MPQLLTEIEKVITGNFPAGETKVTDLIEHCSLYYITSLRTVCLVKKVSDITVDELAGICFLKDGNIHSFAVSREYQRQGYGKKLLKGVILHNNNDLNLIVRASNTGAIALYRSVGFIPTEIKRNFYKFSSIDDDGITMSKKN